MGPNIRDEDGCVGVGGRGMGRGEDVYVWKSVCAQQGKGATAAEEGSVGGVVELFIQPPC